MSLLELGLKGKTAVVTAGAQGIGEGICQALGALGVRVVLVDLERQRPRAIEVVDAIMAAGGEAVFEPCDATDAAAVDKVLAGVAERWGELDVAVGCVGGGEVARADFLDQPLDQYLKCTELTQHTAYYLAQSAGRLMKAQGRGGRIVLIGSIMADFSSPRAAAYSAGKAALRQMAKTAAVELGPEGITVNVVQPGWIDTPGERRMAPDAVDRMAEVAGRLPLRRMGSPSDIANIVGFLCSDAAAYITGSVFDCDGGYKVAMSI
eukprot:CAMPEP_0206286184 /NCGR_PEP_ID=MMETSP0106_2-20121207/472_1 /ASSEMBLY_ACC=CAM_ASM_000206 /TAXON_ID=81532 /ORGANISM="Acanthoeca-like sp., Strain 10tr" /LENGTH=263 /DNA_ID=CAMNT_0053716703 /DNA_START=103 /DNA_END=894 /DNA_ORIENTATION=+